MRRETHLDRSGRVGLFAIDRDDCERVWQSEDVPLCQGVCCYDCRRKEGPPRVSTPDLVPQPVAAIIRGGACPALLLASVQLP